MIKTKKNVRTNEKRENDYTMAVLLSLHMLSNTNTTGRGI